MTTLPVVPPEGDVQTLDFALWNLATPKGAWQRASGLEPSFRREIQRSGSDGEP